MNNTTNDFNELADSADNAGNHLGGMALKAEGALSVLQDIGSTIAQLAKNPLASAVTLGVIGNKLRDHITKELKDVNKYSLEEVSILKKIADHLPNMMRLSGAFTSVALSAAEAYRQTVKVSNEIVKFSSLSNLPGGAQTPFQATQYLIGQKSKYEWTFGQELAKAREDQYLRMLPYTRGMLETVRSNEALHFAVYSNQLGDNMAERFATSMEQFKGRGTSNKEIINALNKAAGLSLAGAYGEGTSSENFATLMQIVKSLGEKGKMRFAPAFAAAQTLLTSLKAGGINNQQVISLLDQITTLATTPGGRITREFFGLDTHTALENPVGFLQQIQNFARKPINDFGLGIAPGTTRYNVGAVKGQQIEGLLSRMAPGMSPDLLWDVLSIDLGQVTNKVKTFGSELDTATKKLPSQYKEFEEGYKPGRGLEDIYHSIKDYFINLAGSAAKASGLDVATIQTAAIGAGALGAWKARKLLPMSYRGMKRFMMQGSEVVPGATALAKEDAAWLKVLGGEVEGAAVKEESNVLSKLFKGKGGKAGGIAIGALLFSLLSSKDTKGAAIETAAAVAATKMTGFTGANLLLDPSVLGDATRTGAALKRIKEGNIGSLTDQEIRDLTRASGGGLEAQKYFYDLKNEALSRRWKRTSSLMVPPAMNTSASDATKVSTSIRDLAKETEEGVKGDIKGNLTVMFTNERGDSLAQTNVALSTQEGSQQIIKIFLGGVTNGGLGG